MAAASILKNRKMAMAAITKNRKLTISQQQFDWSQQKLHSDAHWHVDAYLPTGS